MPNWFLSWPDCAALLFFAAMWIGYRQYAIHARRKGLGLYAQMASHRIAWMVQMSRREVRIVDTAIMGSLQNGTAFFASTSLIAIGGAVTLLRAADDVLKIASDLPLAPVTTRGIWELKVIGLAAIFGYAFFKFAWAYRVFNYAAILIGATPPASSADKQALRAASLRAGRMSVVAGDHFAAGQRALFFSFAYMGWFLGPYVFIATTAIITYVVWARQFASSALGALDDLSPEELQKDAT